jgi:hypothetical protein
MMPFTSFSRTVISDSDLKDVTAESGTLPLNNNTDNSLNLTSAALYGSDGFISYAGACYAGLPDINISGAVNADIGANACYAGLSNFDISGPVNLDLDTKGFIPTPNLLLPASNLSDAKAMSVLGGADANLTHILDTWNRNKAIDEANAAAASRPVYSSGSYGAVLLISH